MSAVTVQGVDFRDLPASAGLLQSPFWGEMKGRFGWTPRGFLINGKHPLLVLLRELWGGLSLAYVPHGPEHLREAQDPWQELKELSLALKPFLPKGSLFLRWDPPWGETVPAVAAEEEISRARQNLLLPPAPFRRAAMDIQPVSTVKLDLTPDPEAIMAAMKKKNRYNIRLAARKGVTVREGSLEELPIWHKLYEETARRDNITLHSPLYYETLFKLARETEGEAAPQIRLWLAEIDGTAEAAIVTAFYRGEATYLYGASSNRRRNLMPTYALQWEALQQAKTAGCLTYDLYGIPPGNIPGHPMEGLYRFKTGFGGSILHRPGSWDFPLKPGLYRCFRLAETARNHYYRRMRKR